jgi:hypothetical protein
MHGTCCAHDLIHLKIQTILGNEHKLQYFLLSNFIDFFVKSSFLGSYIHMHQIMN